MNISITSNDPLADLPVEDLPTCAPYLVEDLEEDPDDTELVLREYRVRVTRRVEIIEECYVHLSASSEEDAEEQVEDDIYGHCDSWEYCGTASEHSENVEGVEEI